jgi:hypothetical protein
MTGVPDKAEESVRSGWGAIFGFWLRVATKCKSWPFSWPATFRKKWPVGARRFPMSAKAEAKALSGGGVARARRDAEGDRASSMERAPSERH